MLAVNGKINFTPLKASQVLRIDHEAQTARLLGLELEGVARYGAGGVLVANGNL